MITSLSILLRTAFLQIALTLVFAFTVFASSSLSSGFYVASSSVPKNAKFAQIIKNSIATLKADAKATRYYYVDVKNSQLILFERTYKSVHPLTKVDSASYEVRIQGVSHLLKSKGHSSFLLVAEDASASQKFSRVHRADSRLTALRKRQKFERGLAEQNSAAQRVSMHQ